ncbi:MAG: hypothetical protein ACWA5P_11915 [bacterium]
MQQFLTILSFYRPYFIWSSVATLGIIILFPSVQAAIITKLLLVWLLWNFLNRTKAKRRLQFFQKLGYSTIKLLSSAVIIDLCLTISTLIIVKEFI